MGTDVRRTTSESPTSFLTLVRSMEGQRPAEFSAAEYLQLGQASRRTFRIELPTGHIELVDGHLHRAEDAEGEGEPALMRLLASGGLTGEAQARCLVGGTMGTRNLHIGVDSALLEAARQMDEAGRDCSAPPADDATFDDDAQRAVEAGLEAVLRKDYRSAHDAFTRAQSLGEHSPLVRMNLKRHKNLIDC